MSSLSSFLLHSAAQHAASSKKRLSRLIPFSLIGTAVACLDLTLILGTSLLTGVGYHLVLYNWKGHGDIATFFGVGALTAVNFTAILSAWGAYRPHHLASFRKQLEHIS